MTRQDSDSGQPQEKALHWPLVYAAAAGFAVITMAALAVFSRFFSG